MPAAPRTTETRDALLRAATDLLDEGGPGNVTLREVGRRAGVSHNAPYKHFPDKDSLLAGVAALELQTYSDLIRTRRTLPAALRAYSTRALSHPERFRLVYRPWAGDHPDLATAAGTAVTALRTLVVRAQSTGVLPPGPPDLLADLLRTLTHGAIDLSLSGHLAKGAATDVDDLLTAFLTLVDPQGRGSTHRSAAGPGRSEPRQLRSR